MIVCTIVGIAVTIVLEKKNSCEAKKVQARFFKDFCYFPKNYFVPGDKFKNVFQLIAAGYRARQLFYELYPKILPTYSID